MLYDKYLKKTKKKARFFSIVKRFRILISSVALFIVASTATLLGIAGTIYEDGVCPTEITYGQAVSYSSEAIFKTVWYEYAEINSQTWSLSMPTDIGQYKVRSACSSVFGNVRYGKEQSFSINKKDLLVTISEDTVVYGEHPAVSADLAFDDAVVCENYIYDNFVDNTASVKLDASSIKLTDAEGNDVSSNYNILIDEQPTEIKFNKRNINLIVGGGVKEYDGTPLTCSTYTVSPETPLAFSDTITADTIEFIGSQTLAGNSQNLLNKDKITLFNGNFDVSSNYNIIITPGVLTVEKREIKIQTYSTQPIEYDAQLHDEQGFAITSGELVNGQTLEIASYTKVKNAGRHANIIDFKVFEGEQDLTENYNIVAEYGVIDIAKRNVNITIDSYERVYNAQPLSASTTGFLQQNVIENHDVKLIFNGSQKNVGSSSTLVNRENSKILEGAEDVTNNYNINYVDGTLTITARPIDFTTNSKSWTYDGSYHSYNSSNAEAQTDGRGLISTHSYTTSNLTEVIDYSLDETLNRMTFTIWENGVDITPNYSLDYDAFSWGTLAINKRPIKIISSSQKVYDGYEFAHYNTITTDSTSQYTMATGDVITAETYRSSDNYINAGSYPNYINEQTISIQSTSRNKSVYDNYVIEALDGELKITKRQISIYTGTSSWTYDDTSHNDKAIGLCDDCTLAPNHEFYVVESSLPSVRYFTEGAKTNSFTYEIHRSGSSENLIDNYEVLEQSWGEISILKRDIAFSSAGGEWTYNDEYFYNNQGYSVLNNYSLAGDNKLKLDDYTKVMTYTAGTPNELEISIWSGDGSTDLTENYNILTNKCEWGTLKVNKRKISIYTGSSDNTWIFDDVSHTKNEIGLYGECSLAPRHVFYVVESTLPSVRYFTDGTKTNSFTYEIRRSGYTDNLIDNYQILEQRWGQISILQRDIAFETASNAWTYDDRFHSETNSRVISGSLVSGHQQKAKDGTYNQVRYYTENPVKNSFEFQIFSGEADLTLNYNVIYENCVWGDLRITKKAVTLATKSKSWVFDDESHFLAEMTEASLAELLSYYDSGVLIQHNIVPIDSTVDSVRYVTDGVNGITKNDFTFKIVRNNQTEDLINNYAITLTFGDLSITPREIVLKPQNQSQVYNDQEYKPSFRANSDMIIDSVPTGKEYTRALLSGHTITSATLIYGDTSTNAYRYYKEAGWVSAIQSGSIIIKDANSKDITDNYEFSYETGLVRINKRAITFQTASEEWIYNDQTYFNEGNSVVNGFDGVNSLISGHGRKVISRTDVKNYTPQAVYNELGIEIYRISTDEDLTNNYEISYIKGSLVVHKRKITLTAGSSSKVYDDKKFELEKEYISDSWGEGVDLALVEKQGLDKALKKGHYISSATFTYPDLTSNLNAYYFVGGWTNRIDKNSVVIHNGSGDVSTNYEIVSCIDGTLTITQRDISFKTLSNDSNPFVYNDVAFSYVRYEIFSGSLQSYNGETHIVAVDDLASITLVKDSGKIDNTMTFRIFRKNSETETTDNYNISVSEYGKLYMNARDLVVKAKDISKIYDDTPLFSEKGNQEHFELKNGTTLVEEKANPSIYTLYVEYTGERTDAGTEDTIPIRASIKVLKNGNVDLTENYNITLYDGEGKGVLLVKQRPIVVTSEEASVVYDDKDHSYKSVFIDTTYIDNENYFDLVSTHSIIITSEENTIHDVDDGEVENSFAFKICRNGQENDISSNYIITKNWKYLQILPRPFTITTPDLSWVYDAQTHSGEHDEQQPVIEAQNGDRGLLNSHTLVMDNWSTIKNVLETGVDNKFEYTIKKGDQEINLNNYDVNFEKGKLTITPRPINFTTIDKSWTYDGLIHSIKDIENNYQVEQFNEENKSGLISGHIFDIDENTWATITIVAENGVDGKDNSVKYEIFDEGDNVSGNYEPIITWGKLKILPRTITIKTESQNWTYDGEAHSHMVYSILDTGEDCGLAPNQTIPDKEYLEWSSITNVMEADDGLENGRYNKFELVVLDGTGITNVGANYAPVWECGILTLTKRVVHVKTVSETFTYDGKPHENKEFEVTGGVSLVAGHMLSATGWASITNVGEKENTITENSAYVAGYVKDKYENSYELRYNYEIIVDGYGTLTVEMGEYHITIKPDYPDSSEYGYVNKSYVEYLPDTYTVDGMLIQGHKVVLKEGRTLAYDLIDLAKEGAYIEMGTWQYRIASTADDFDIVDKDGVSVKANYDSFIVSDEVAYLNIVKAQIEFILLGHSLTYNGEEYTFGWDYNVKNSPFQEPNYTISASGYDSVKIHIGTLSYSDVASNLQIDIDIDESKYEYSWAKGTENVKVEIIKRHITITAVDATITVSPEEHNFYLEAPYYTVGKDGLANGDSLSVVVTGEIDYIGKADNTISSYSLSNAYGDTDKCYIVDEVKNGTLTILLDNKED